MNLRIEDQEEEWKSKGTCSGNSRKDLQPNRAKARASRKAINAQQEDTDGLRTGSTAKAKAQRRRQSEKRGRGRFVVTRVATATPGGEQHQEGKQPVIFAGELRAPGVEGGRTNERWRDG
ncbi:hypothetical protein ANO11243_044290 [Dothideomycetidae sp. 11243]|nr:hypothetical protein ANO11243_044290 [fungal sp. No.11243]